MMSRLAWLALLMLLPLSGCVSPQTSVARTPTRYEVESDDLIIRSDLKIRSDHPLLAELKEIRSELTELLNLPPATRPVVVHLFGNEERYTAYMQARHPGLPMRRAFFIGSPTELGVYAHWSENVAEDLRHEYTHGVLHASLRSVPLWLDEGLAEYFETRTRDAQRRHPEHAPRLKLAMSNGWRPDIERLEQIENVNQMGTADYQEAWAWIHFLIHEAPDGRQLLVDYCHTLRRSDKPPRFSKELAGILADGNLRLASYLAITLGNLPVREQWAVGQNPD